MIFLFIIITMIRHVYAKSRLWNGYQAFWCILVFLVNNIYFGYITLKVSFQPFVPNLPWPISVAIFLILLTDTLYTPVVTQKICGFRWILDFIICIFVLLSLFIPNSNVAGYLGLAITIRLYDVIYLK